MRSSACIRQEWVYYAWGLVVLFVGLGYSAMLPLLLDVIFVFHYPLLFFMAGYFCSPNADGAPRDIRSATRIAVILIVAYLALSLLNALLLQALVALGLASVVLLLSKHIPPQFPSLLLSIRPTCFTPVQSEEAL